MKAFFLSAALIGVVGLSASAEARPREQTVTAAVEFGDLDLSTTAGYAQLNRRIRSAAAEMCTHDFVRPGRPRFLPERRCYQEAMTSVRLQVAQAIARQGERTLAARR